MIYENRCLEINHWIKLISPLIVKACGRWKQKILYVWKQFSLYGKPHGVNLLSFKGMLQIPLFMIRYFWKEHACMITRLIRILNFDRGLEREEQVDWSDMIAWRSDLIACVIFFPWLRGCDCSNMCNFLSFIEGQHPGSFYPWLKGCDWYLFPCIIRLVWCASWVIERSGCV